MYYIQNVTKITKSKTYMINQLDGDFEQGDSLYK